MFGSGYGFRGTYLFDDGTVGFIADPEFDPEEFTYGDGELIDDELYINGQHAIGNLYIDRFDMEGEFFQGGCFLYFEGEMMKDYCDRNGEPYPVRRIPDDVYDAFEVGDIKTLKRYSWKIKELKGVRLI